MMTLGGSYLAVSPRSSCQLTFNSDGDDTPHSAIPSYPLPVYVQANASFPLTGKPATVDLVFLDYIQSDVTGVLSTLGVKVSDSQVKQYLPKSFTTNSYLPLYAKEFWSKGPVCPVGQGVQ